MHAKLFRLLPSVIFRHSLELADIHRPVRVCLAKSFTAKKKYFLLETCLMASFSSSNVISELGSAKMCFKMLLQQGPLMVISNQANFCDY